MRVATYTQPMAPTRGSIVGILVLVVTILLGTGVVPTLANFVGGPIVKLMTPGWFALYLLAFLGLMFTHGINWISWLVRYRILLVVLILGTVLSVSWSMDARVSAERTVHLVGSTLIAVYIGFTVPLLTTLRVFALVLGLFILASVASVIGLPALGIEHYEGTQVWRGVFNSKNDLGFWAAIGVLLYVTLSDSTQRSSLKILCFLMAGLCVGVLGMSHSATSLLAMLVAGALSLYLFVASRFKLGFVRMAVMAVLFTAVIALAVANLDTAELVGRTNDLTGRGEVWRQTLKLIMERPLTGVGYGSLWFPTDATIWIQQSLTDFTWVVFHAHNGLLQIASEVGIPLSLIALLMVAQQLIEIFYCQYERQQVGVLFVLAFVTAYLISNFSEARFLVTRELFWIFFLALPISMLRQINLVSEESQMDADSEDPDAQVFTPAYSAVPGKPWLGPLPQEIASINVTTIAGGAASASLAIVAGQGSQVADRQDTQSHTSKTDELLESNHTLSDSDSLDDFDLAAHTLSIDESDIDLGVITGAQEDNGEMDTTSPGSQTAVDTHLMQDDIIDVQRHIESESIRYNDTLDVDRYDINLDLTGEWIDIPLEDD